jgi:hypothetical protein
MLAAAGASRAAAISSGSEIRATLTNDGVSARFAERDCCGAVALLGQRAGDEAHEPARSP